MLSARSESSSPSAVHRDRFVWVAYLFMAHFTYAQAVFGPIGPFLRDELALSYTVAALPFSALALSAALTGLALDQVIGRWGRAPVFWASGVGVSAGLLLLATARHPAQAVLSGALIGIFGSGGLVTVQAALSDRFAAQRTVVLTESTLAASFAGSMAPALVGGAEAGGLGWRWALIGVAAAWALVLVMGWRARVPEVAERDTRRASRAATRSHSRVALPPLFQRLLIVVLLLTSVQWSLTLWGANFLRDEVGFDRVWASSLMWVYLTALVVARLALSRLTRRFTSERLLVAAILLAVTAFPVFWLAPWPLLNVVGMLALGLGAGCFYPLSVALAISAVPQRADAASSRSVVGVGLAMLVVPQALGALADAVGLMAAFSLLVILLPATLLLTMVANRAAARHNRAHL